MPTMCYHVGKWLLNPDNRAMEKMVGILVFVSFGLGLHVPSPVAGRPMFLEVTELRLG